MRDARGKQGQGSCFLNGMASMNLEKVFPRDLSFETIPRPACNCKKGKLILFNKLKRIRKVYSESWSKASARVTKPAQWKGAPTLCGKEPIALMRRLSRVGYKTGLARAEREAGPVSAFIPDSFEHRSSYGRGPPPPRHGPSRPRKTAQNVVPHRPPVSRSPRSCPGRSRSLR